MSFSVNSFRMRENTVGAERLRYCRSFLRAAKMVTKPRLEWTSFGCVCRWLVNAVIRRVNSDTGA